MDPLRIRNHLRRSDPAPTRHISSSRRTFSSSSFSSLSSCSSSSGDSPVHSPATALRLLGVPFSWEQLPGKPKEPHEIKNNEPINLLPLPPRRSCYFPNAGKNQTNHRKKNTPFPVKDPFTAALMECSREDGDDDGNQKSYGGSSKDRFGLVNLYESCRKSCSVSESIVYIPRSTGASSYHYLMFRRRR